RADRQEATAAQSIRGFPGRVAQASGVDIPGQEGGEMSATDPVQAVAEAIRAHDPVRMACLDHEEACCPCGEAHDMTYSQAAEHQAAAAIAVARPAIERDALAARLAAVVQVLTDWGALADDGDFVGDSDFAEAIHDSGAWRLSRDL